MKWSLASGRRWKEIEPGQGRGRVGRRQTCARWRAAGSAVSVCASRVVPPGDPMPAPTRLQIGTSRIENLPPPIVATFSDRSWVSLGEPPPAKTDAKPRPRFGRAPKHPPYDPAHYRGLHFMAWYFRPGL